MKQYTKEFYIKTLSPIHVGCGEDYEPTNSVIDSKDCVVVSFNPVQFFRSLGDQDRKRFSDICLSDSADSLFNVYKFMFDRKVKGRQVEMSRSLLADYRNTMLSSSKKLEKGLKKFCMQRTAYLLYDGRPFIPGSAIKGAIRTAYLNKLHQDQPINRKFEGNESKKLEKEILKDNSESTEKDPLRFFKVSDFLPVGDVKSKLMYAVNQKKRPSNYAERGVYHILEVIKPGAVFKGSITIYPPEKSMGISKAITWDDFSTSLKEFFSREFEMEKKVYRLLGSQHLTDALDGEKALLRIGRHSGAECVTIEGHRQIKIMTPQGRGNTRGSSKPKFSNASTTMWLCAEDKNIRAGAPMRPFGWVKIAEVPLSQEEDYLKIEEEYLDEARESERKELAEEQEAIRKREEEDKKRADAVEREKQRRELIERIKTLSKEEAFLAKVEHNLITQEEVDQCANQIDSFCEENKQKIAEKIKEYYVANNKWSGSLAPKQKEKVSKIKKILGEN